ncbi:MAG: DUF3124 domain-containing protein [Rhodocyclaceae bacterium]|nr:DUF3124 domain-containing protein [Rhodocyclaceae bacterium]
MKPSPTSFPARLPSWPGRLLAALMVCAAAGAAAQEGPPLSRGQTLYLPIYSHVYHGNLDRKGQPDKVLLSALVSIRNTDPKRSMKLTSARYYNTDGKLLREFVPAPRPIGPFGTVELFVERHDESGGSGANFMIAWEGEAPMNPPLVEAIHAFIDGARSAFMTTLGQPLRTSE